MTTGATGPEKTLRPDLDLTHSLGTASKRWKKLWVGEITTSGNITISGVTGSTEQPRLLIPDINGELLDVAAALESINDSQGIQGQQGQKAGFLYTFSPTNPPNTDQYPGLNSFSFNNSQLNLVTQI